MMGLSTRLFVRMGTAPVQHCWTKFGRSMNTLRLVTILSGLLVAGCAGVPVHEALPVGARDKFTSTDIVVPVTQNEIYVYVPPSNISAATGGGLIEALVDVTVDSIRTSKAENSVKALRDSLVDFDFDKALQADLAASLEQKPWMRVRDVHVVKDATSDSLDRALTNSTADAVLFTTVDYRLSNDGDVLSIWLEASLFPKSDGLKAFKQQGSAPKTNLKNSLYHNKFDFQFSPPNVTDDRAHNMPMWTAQNGVLMRAALKLGAAKLSQMLAMDLEQQTQADSTSGEITVRNELDAPTSLKGQTVSTDADGTIFRNADGSLYFMATGFAKSLAAN